MDLTGKRVHHRSFGDGVITEQKKTTIVVTFRDGSKMFSYPGCFQTYLKILDTDLKEDVQEVVSQHEHAETAESMNFKRRFRQTVVRKKTKVFR